MYVMKVDNKRVYIATEMMSNTHPNKKYHRDSTAPGYELLSDDKFSTWVPAEKIGPEYQILDPITEASIEKFAEKPPVSDTAFYAYTDKGTGLSVKNKTAVTINLAFLMAYSDDVDYTDQEGNVLWAAGTTVKPIKIKTKSVPYFRFLIEYNDFFSSSSDYTIKIPMSFDLSEYFGSFPYSYFLDLSSTFSSIHSIREVSFESFVHPSNSAGTLSPLNIASLFGGCSKLEVVNLKGLHLDQTGEQIAYHTAIFNNCPALHTIIVGSNSDKQWLLDHADAIMLSESVEIIVQPR